ncbi:MAG: endonuclease/exonuclease/phosphatase family protein [Flavobacteriales bacterium]|nr:endonuclease/exonuclease/phosphatase family protein [Flavobacteriales bacterium]
MNNIQILSLFAGLFLLVACQNTQPVAEQPKSGSDSLTVAFYNVENLYDVTDDPKTEDEDFTPEGKYKWTADRYAQKLQKLAEVFDAMPGELPAFIGMVEIENRNVLEDLVKENLLSKGNYGIIHQDSPDERGIDVAAIYDKKRLNIEDFQYIKIVLPDSTDRTRDMLYVKAKVKNETIHFFVNHWPSRRGGQSESEISRITVAKVLKSEIEKIKSADTQAKILCMGDFNDHPVDKSIAEVLNAGIQKDNTLYNYMYTAHTSGRGTYYYKGEWGALDQFIATKTLQEATTGWKSTSSDAHIFNPDLVMFQDDKGLKRPNRTYVGEDYKGGYSDHLSIYIVLRR